MADYIYDLVVIGSGPAGEGAAMNAVKQGLRVAVIDDRTQPGGGCTHSLSACGQKEIREAAAPLSVSERERDAPQYQ